MPNESRRTVIHEGRLIEIIEREPMTAEGRARSLASSGQIEFFFSPRLIKSDTKVLDDRARRDAIELRHERRCYEGG